MTRSEVAIRVWRAAGVPLLLIAIHFLIGAYVDWRNIEYDTSGLEGPLWWVVAFWVLPIIALLMLAWRIIVKSMI